MVYFDGIDFRIAIDLQIARDVDNGLHFEPWALGGNDDVLADAWHCVQDVLFVRLQAVSPC